MPSKTILYYTAHLKPRAFEEKIRQTILANCGGLPIVSVTHKPIDFGTNICVGDVGVSYANVFRQQLIGAEAVKTRWIVIAEDDYLLTPEYFAFNPRRGGYYRYENSWLLSWHGVFHRAFPANAMVRRDFALRTLTQCLEGWPMWSDGGGKVQTGKKEFMGEPYELYTGTPIVAIKAAGNLSRVGYCGSSSVSLEPWGRADAVRRMYGVERGDH